MAAIGEKKSVEWHDISCRRCGMIKPYSMSFKVINDYPTTDCDAMMQLQGQHVGKNATLLYNLFGVYWKARAGGESTPDAYLTTQQVYLKSIGAEVESDANP